MVAQTFSALILDDQDRPGAPDDELDDEALIEPEDLDAGWESAADSTESIPVTADEEHLLKRMLGKGVRENGARAEGDDLLDDDLYPSSRFEDEE